MFNDFLFQLYEKRNKLIIDHYGYTYFFGKKLLDLGCGFADSSSALYRLGTDTTAVDARQEHLNVVSKKYSKGIKVIKADLDKSFPFTNQKFDIVLDLGLICHLEDFKKHLIQVCKITTDLILETAVIDSNEDKCIQIPENKAYNLSFNGMGCRPSPSAIEKILTECGMSFKRINNSKYNAGEYSYDWRPKNNNDISINKRPNWFGKNNHIQASQHVPNIIFTPPVIQDDMRIGRRLKASPRTPSILTTPTQENNMPENKPVIINGSPSLNYNDKDKKFVIVIPSYNNNKWCEKNIQSALDQNYTNY